MKSVELLIQAQVELDQLQTARMQLAESMTRHADRLREFGSIPSEELLAGLRDYTLRMQQVVKSLPAATLAVQPVESAADWQSHECLKSVVKSSLLKLKATEILAQIPRLKHQDLMGFAPLVSCQVAAERLTDAIEQGVNNQETLNALQQLSSASHPFNALVTLVTEGDYLPDEQWTKLNDELIAAFGRPLATAVARGKIWLDIKPDSDAAAVSGTVPAVAPPIEPVSETHDSRFDLYDSSRDEVRLADDVSTGARQCDESDHLEMNGPAISEVAPETSIVENIKLPSPPLPVSVFETKEPTQSDVSCVRSETGLEVSEQSRHAQDMADESAEGVFRLLPVQTDRRTEILPQESSGDSIFDSIGASSKSGNLPRGHRVAELKLVSDQPFKWTQPEGSRRPSGDASSAKATSHLMSLIARNALQTDGDARHALLSRVVLQLLTEDRLALAFHLTRCIENRLPGYQTNLPSWLIQALVLSRHVCYSKGEIARKIEESLRGFSPQLLSTGDGDWNEATGFFVRAAALIPALLTSSPTASAILRSFRITPGLSHLYNYCSRLSTYGHRLQGQAADLFTPDCDMARWESEMAGLQNAIEVWLSDSVKKVCPTSRSSLLFLHAHWTLTSSTVSKFSESARLWSKWQECFRIVHRLLKPVRHAQEQERNWVKGEIERLTQLVYADPVTGESLQALPVGAITFPQEAMLQLIREGVDYASRWLRLCASKPTQGRTLASRDAEALRDEILERTDAVLAELSVFQQQHTSQRTLAAIACLCSTIEHLRSIFSPHSTLALREADLRHVIYGELLKIPHLRMNEQWAPAVDVQILENEILTYLSGEPRDWKQAFELQSAQRDHLATERILQLNVWRTEQERESLRRRRNGEIQACQDELRRDLAEARKLIAEESEQKRIPLSLQLATEQRLQRVENELETSVDFAALQNELTQARLGLERHKRELLNVEKRGDLGVSNARPTVKFIGQNPSLTAPANETEDWSQNIFSEH